MDKNKMETQNSSKFQYILRFAVQPGHDEDEKLSVLLDFCKEALIDEVMFFINCEELNQGHLTIEETKPWMDLIAKGKKLLETIGVKTSINPWITLLHCDRGRKLKDNQDFRLMVDPYGNQAGAVVCPLCSSWQKYISEMYSYYATLKPNVVWVEDDFRLHNHNPLIWGGCFCERHMEEYSKYAAKLGIIPEGRILSREEFVGGILKKGEVHPYRKVWLDVSRHTMIKLAELIGEAVHKVSPETKVGLMSSAPYAHCAEGRDWEAILKGLAGNNPPVIRPHLPAYGEMIPRDYMFGFTIIPMLTRMFLPEETEIYPELENFPHTRFSKSKTFSAFQIETSILLDSKGITMNIYDMMGNGILPGEGYQYMLAGIKNFLNQLTSLNLSALYLKGVKIPVCQESSYTLKIQQDKGMEGLYPSETFWAKLLAAYGIANLYTRGVEHKNSVIAVSGQYFRNLSEREIKDLFENNYVLLEGEAAYTLWEMGYGHLAGIGSIIRYEANTGKASYEEICNGETYAGVKKGRMTCQGHSADYLEIKYIDKDKLEVISKVKNPYGETVGEGMVIYNNKVFVLPYVLSEGKLAPVLNPIRQEAIQNVLLKLQKGKLQQKGGKEDEDHGLSVTQDVPPMSLDTPTMVLNAPFVSVYDYSFTDKRVLIVVNASGDDFDEVKIKLASDIPVPKSVYEISKGSNGMVKSDDAIANGELVFKGLKNLELKAFILNI